MTSGSTWWTQESLSCVCGSGFYSTRDLILMTSVCNIFSKAMPPYAQQLCIRKSLTSAQMLRFAERFPSLINLVFAISSASWTNEFACALSGFFPNLQGVLCRCPSMKDSFPVVLGEICTSLRTVDFSECRGITNVSLVDLSAHCRLLEKVNVGGTCVTGFGIAVLARRCRSLCDLVAHGCNGMNQAIHALSKYSSNLQCLNLDCCEDVDDHSLCTLAQKCSELREVRVDSTEATDESIFCLAQHCRQLRRGSFLFCDITFTAIGALVQSYTNLEWLHVSLLPSREERRAIRQWRLRGIRVHCLYIDDDTDLRESDSEDFPGFDFDDDRSEFPEFASLMKSFPHCRPGEPRQIIGKAVSFMR